MGAPQYEQAGADIAGGGTAGTIPVWSTGSTLGNSGITDNGSTVSLVSRTLSQPSSSALSVLLGTNRGSRVANAQVAITSIAAGADETNVIGLFAEALASGGNGSSAIYGHGWTSGALSGTGLTGEGHVTASGDTARAIGVKAYATDTHAGGSNIGLRAQASGGATNYAIDIMSGDILSENATNWTLASSTSALNIGSNLFTLDTTNNRAGINNAAPATALHVGSATAGQTTARVQTQGAADKAPIYSLFRSGVNEHVMWAGSGTIRWGIATDPAGYTDAQLLTATKFGIDSSGNVGIGTTSPGAKLSIAGTGGAAAINLTETGVRNWAIRSGGAFTNVFDIADLTAGQSRLAIDSSGNVGIGTASPGTQLHVERAGGTSNAEYLRLRNTSAGTGSAVGIEQYVSANTVATGRIQHAWNGTTYDTIFSNWNGSALAEAARTVGGTTPVLSTPNGLKLPSTPGNADAQTLDAYYENPLATTSGNGWTPTIGGTAAQWGGTLPTVNFARYVQIGSIVFCDVRLSGAAIQSTYGVTTITPPPPAQNAYAYEVVVPASTSVGGATGNGAQFGGVVYVPTLTATTVIRLTWFYFTTS